MYPDYWAPKRILISKVKEDFPAFSPKPRPSIENGGAFFPFLNLFFKCNKILQCETAASGCHWLFNNPHSFPEKSHARPIAAEPSAWTGATRKTRNAQQRRSPDFSRSQLAEPPSSDDYGNTFAQAALVSLSTAGSASQSGKIETDRRRRRVQVRRHGDRQDDHSGIGRLRQPTRFVSLRLRCQSATRWQQTTTTAGA